MKEIIIKDKDTFITALANGHTVWRNDDISYNKAAESQAIYRTVFYKEGGCGMFVVEDVEKEWNDKYKFYYLD